MEEPITLFFYDKPSRSVLPQHLSLNNYYYSPISHEGVAYPTVEHFYQAHKYPLGSNEFELIRTSATPNQAKQLTRQLPYDGEWWESVKVEVMRLALRLKFAQNPEFRRELRLTWNCQLIEDSPKDAYWGGAIPGARNVLGELLKEERERLRNEGSDRPVPPLYWLLKPYHLIFPAPVPAPISIPEAIYQVSPTVDLQDAISRHPVLSLLPPVSLSALLSTAVQISLPPLESVQRDQTLVYVLAGSGMYESDKSFMLYAGMWMETAQIAKCKYAASESGLSIAELSLPAALSTLSDFHGSLIDSILWKPAFLANFRTKLSELTTSRAVLTSELVSTLNESLPFLFTPNTVLDSLMYLPVTAHETNAYCIDLHSCRKGVQYEERSRGNLLVSLGTEELEQFAFHIVVFEELKRRIRERKVPKEVELHLETHIPKYWKECLQAELLQEVTLRLTDSKLAQFSEIPHFSQFSISSVDILLADVQKCAYLFSPYLQTISESSKSITAANVQGEAKTDIYCAQYNLMVNPEQLYRATELDSLIGVHHTVINGQPALLLSPQARVVLGCASGDAHLICLDVSCGGELVDVLEEIAERIRSVSIVETWKDRQGNAVVEKLISAQQSVICETDITLEPTVVTGFVPTQKHYFLDPITSHCIRSLARELAITDISPDALSALTALLRVRKVPVRAVVPCSEASEMQFIEKMSGKLSSVRSFDSGVILIQYGPGSESLSQLYEAATVILHPETVHEVISAAWHFNCEVQTTALELIRDRLVSLLKLQSPHLTIAWTDLQVSALMGRLQPQVRVFLFSQEDLAAEGSAQVTVLTTSRGIGHPTSFTCELDSGTWMCRGTTNTLSLTQVLSHFT